MKYLLTAIGIMVAVSISSTVFAEDAKERIADLTNQIKAERSQVKTLRAQDRVNKAVDKFCQGQDTVKYRICVNGAFELASNPSTKR